MKPCLKKKNKKQNETKTQNAIFFNKLDQDLGGDWNS